MLRINLLHDAGHDEAPAESSSVLLYLVGVLVLALCVAIGLVGWLTSQTTLTQAQEAHAAAEAELASLAARVPPEPSYDGLVALEQEVLDLRALLQHQELRPLALLAALEALDFDSRRDTELALQSLRFDGQTLQASGRARDIDVLTSMLDTLQADRSLTDARFTSLRAADEPLIGRPRRGRLPAIDFELYAAIPAPPLSEQE